MLIIICAYVIELINSYFHKKLLLMVNHPLYFYGTTEWVYCFRSLTVRNVGWVKLQIGVKRMKISLLAKLYKGGDQDTKTAFQYFDYILLVTVHHLQHGNIVDTACATTNLL